VKILRRILIFILCIVSLLISIGFLLPSRAYVERKLEINAFPEIVFKQLNTLKNWENWSPWLKDDTSLKFLYSGPESGPGASFSWLANNSSNEKYTVKIISSAPFDSLHVVLDFGLSGKTSGKFILNRVNNITVVSWSLESSIGMNPVSRWVALFTDKLVGPDLERGLLNIEELLLETDPSEEYDIVFCDVPSTFLLTIRDTVTPARVTAKFANMYQQLSFFLNSRHLSPTGSPIVIYHNISSQIFDIEVGIPITSLLETPYNIACIQTEAKKTIRLRYFGSYNLISSAYNYMQNYINERRLQVSGPSWEEFVTDPLKEPDSNKWQTNIYFPLK